MNSEIVFIIGPGGAGKTTSGKIFANLVGYDFIDLDQEFCRQIENVGVFITKYGYKKYCYENSRLFKKILQKIINNCVVVLSSGFLVHQGLDNLISKHHNLLKKYGTSVLLLPSKDEDAAIKIIVNRQLNRGLNYNKKREEEKIRSRFKRYMQFGDIQIFSIKSPEKIANQIMLELNLKKQHERS